MRFIEPLKIQHKGSRDWIHTKAIDFAIYEDNDNYYKHSGGTKDPFSGRPVHLSHGPLNIISLFGPNICCFIQNIGRGGVDWWEGVARRRRGLNLPNVNNWIFLPFGRGMGIMGEWEGWVGVGGGVMVYGVDEWARMKPIKMTIVGQQWPHTWFRISREPRGQWERLSGWTAIGDTSCSSEACILEPETMIASRKSRPQTLRIMPSSP